MNDNKNQYTENYMVSFSEALNLVLESTQLKNTERVNLDCALNRVLAKPVVSTVNIPPFDNSAMDGYAVNAEDLKRATSESPVTLQLSGVTAAGDGYSNVQNSKGSAWKVMTGAAVPKGFDSIIPVENTQLENTSVICFSSPQPGDHIRTQGEDFRINEQVLQSGNIINANAIMALAALGTSQLTVYKKLNIALFSTGKELVDDPNIELAPGQIRNSNKPFILDWLKDFPVKTFNAGTNYDDSKKFARDLKHQLENNVDIIISSGAVSMGDFDFIPQTIKELGGEIIFHKSKIRPGKPILFASFANGSLYFGLPGNPISAAIGLRFFVSACIRKRLGLSLEKPIVATSNQVYNKKVGFRSILKADAQVSNSGQLKATILDGQESFKIKPLLAANGWVMLGESLAKSEKGEQVEFYPSTMSWG